MALTFRRNYSTLSDEALLEMITRAPHCEEAAAYLLYERYRPLLMKCYGRVFGADPQWLDDCLGDLFCFLRGVDGQWGKLAGFEWRCRFSSWLIRAASRRFLEMKPYLIGKLNFRLSISDDVEPDELTEVPDAEREFARREREVLMQEAVGLLRDADQRFVVVKRLQGFNSQEIAEQMTEAWEQSGTVRVDSHGRRVTPTAAYIDVRMQRAKAALKLIIAGME